MKTKDQILLEDLYSSIDKEQKETSVKDEISNAIDKINENLNIEDFARAVCDIVKDEYGTHNIETFKRKVNEFLPNENI